MNWFVASMLIVLGLTLAVHMLDHGKTELRLLDRNVYLQQQIIDLPGCVREREA